MPHHGVQKINKARHVLDINCTRASL